MEEESADWCHLGQMIMHKGAEVCRQFIKREILTVILTNYSRYWTDHVHNPADNNYLSVCWNNLNGILKSSETPSDKCLNELLKSLKTKHGIALIEQAEMLKQWKRDIEEKLLNYSVSDSAGVTLKLWLSKLGDEIQELNSIAIVLARWNSIFHRHLNNAQSSLLLEIERNDEFLSSCIDKLKSLSEPNRSELHQLVQSLKQQLKHWKTKCCEVLQKFCYECQNIISSGLKEAQGVRQSYALVKFLNEFKNVIKTENMEAHVDLFCDRWDIELFNVIDIFEKQTREGTSTEAIVSLSQSLHKDLEKFYFKEKKIRDFFSTFIPPKFPRILEQQFSKLKDISGSLDLNKLDLTLLTAIWLKGNFVHSPPQGREGDPHDWDTSTSADILRLREHRNMIVDHISELRTPRDIFEKLWKKLTDLLRKIESQCGDRFNKNVSAEIDQLIYIPCETHNEYGIRKEFLMWCKRDILAQLSAGSSAGCQCLDMLQSIQTELDRLTISRQACTCRICNKEFYIESEFAQHMRNHQVLSCCRCNDTFPTGKDLLNHMRRHQGLKCRMCNMRCATEWEFRRHMWCNRDCKCLLCDDGFSAEALFEEHIRNHQTLVCGICNTECFTEMEFSQHMLSYQVYTCRSCGKDFSTENELEQHMRRHADRTCRSCNRNCSTGAELEEHIRDHQARTCRNCNQEFSTVSELSEHERNADDCQEGSVEFLNSVFRK